MLYLNNPLLTSERIISFFEKNVLTKEHPASSKAPSPLSQLKNKLKANFFEQLDKKSSDQEVLAALSTDDRFNSSYPQLRHVLITLFSLKDMDDKNEALTQLKLFHGTDWNIDNAQAQFETFNTRYHYFDPPSPELFAIFKELAIACRTMIVLFEKNNTQEDTIAYDYAYKLMALFVDPSDANTTKLFDNLSQEAHKLLSQTESKDNKPFHDVLLVKLSLPEAGDLKDQAGWRQFIKQEGHNALPYLALAKKIELKIAIKPGETGPRAPKDLDEAQKMASLCRYDRATTENSTFAELCHKYKVPEDRFNRCLDYLAEPPGWPKKTADSIPNIIIKGEGEAAGFYWVKLPVTDKRSLILGDITDCCQSIGGHSEACVKDAVSLSDNGLYVLLKQRKKTGNPNPLMDGSINDANFDIIGQSYVWKSQLGNVCLDSIECLKDSVPVAALKQITSDFATKLLQDNPDVKRVTVGRGGKTPEKLFSETAIPEKMRQGIPYGDSSSQYCIAKTQRLDDNQIQALNHLLKKQPDKFCECIEYFSQYVSNTTHFVEQLSALLQETPSLSIELTPYSLSKIFALNTHYSLSDLTPVDFNQLDGMESEQRSLALENISTARLLWKTKNASDVLRVLQYLPKNQHPAILNVMVRLTHIIDPVLLHVILMMYPEDQRLERVQTKDGEGKRVLHESGVRSIKVLTAILDVLPPNQRLEALSTKDHYGKTAFWLAASDTDPKCLITMLKALPSEHLLAALRTDGYLGVTFLSSLLAEGWTSVLKPIVEMLSEEQYLDVLNDRDKQGNTLLHLAANKPDCLQLMLDRLSSSERIEALNKTNEKGETVLALCPAGFDPLTGTMTVTQKDYQAVIEQYQSGKRSLASFVHSPDDLKAILSTLPENQRLDALKKSTEYNNQGALSLAIEHPDSIKVILDTLPKNQHREVVEATLTGTTVLARATLTPELLKEILALYPENQRLELVKKKTNAWTNSLLQRATQDKNLMRVILAMLPESQKLEAVKEKDIQGKTVFHGYKIQLDFFKDMLAIIPEDQQLAAMQLKNHLGDTVLQHVVDNADLLKIVLAIYPKELRLDVVKEKEAGLLFSAVRYPDSLKIILSVYPDDQKLEAVKEKNEDGVTLLFCAKTRPNSLRAILDIYPENQRLAAVNEKNKEGKMLLHLVANEPDSLNVILQSLPANERLAALSEKTSYGYTVLHLAARYPNSLKTILECLPSEQRLEALNIKNGYGQTVLQLLNPNALKIILQVMRHDQEPDDPSLGVTL